MLSIYRRNLRLFGEVYWHLGVSEEASYRREVLKNSKNWRGEGTTFQVWRMVWAKAWRQEIQCYE